MKTPMSYYGGKHRMASKILPLFPKHTVYVEPFCGGAAMLFKKPVPAVTNRDHYREVINDVHGEVVNAFRQLRDHGDELHRLLDLTPHSREEHAECKTPYPEGLSDIERARRFLYMINNSFSKKENGGWAYSKLGQSFPAAHRNKVDRIPAAVQRLQGVHIEQSCALDCIATWDSPYTLFYVDPPYVDTEQGHYGGYTMEDYQALVRKLIASKGHWVLSGYSWPDGIDVPDDVTCHEFAASSSAAGHAKRSNIKKNGRARTERVWVHKSSHAPPTSIAKVLTRPEFDIFTGGKS